MAGAMLARCLVLLAFVVITASSLGLPSHNLAPALIWSDLRCSGSAQHRVDYQISSPQYVAETALQQFSSIRKQCSDSAPKSVDMLVAFVGSELRSSDLARNGVPFDTTDILKNLISASNVSLAIPYVANLDGSSVVNSLVRTLEERKDAAVESAVFGCPEAESSKRLLTVLDLEDYIASRKLGEGAVHLLLVCSSASTLGTSASEGKFLEKILSRLEDSGIGYMALYASDPFGSGDYYVSKHRQLASLTTSKSNSSNGTYCDGVCQTKATLLEVFFVAIVLLVILISGLCCMMGIQAPLRFETPHEA